MLDSATDARPSAIVAPTRQSMASVLRDFDMLMGLAKGSTHPTRLLSCALQPHWFHLMATGFTE
jgi:hypothetical protein